MTRCFDYGFWMLFFNGFHMPFFCMLVAFFYSKNGDLIRTTMNWPIVEIYTDQVFSWLCWKEQDFRQPIRSSISCVPNLFTIRTSNINFDSTFGLFRIKN